MPDRQRALQKRVYQRSLRKNIGVLEAIDELLAEATQAEDTRRLEALRLILMTWRDQRGRRPAGAQPPAVEAIPPRRRRRPIR